MRPLSIKGHHVVHILILLCTSFSEFELREVFVEFNGNRASNNENINKVYDLLGHPSYMYLLDATRMKGVVRPLQRSSIDFQPVELRSDAAFCCVISWTTNVYLN